MKLLIRNYLQQKEEAPSKVGLGFEMDRVRSVNTFILTSDMVSKE